MYSNPVILTKYYLSEFFSLSRISINLSTHIKNTILIIQWLYCHFFISASPISLNFLFRNSSVMRRPSGRALCFWPRRLQCVCQTSLLDVGVYWMYRPCQYSNLESRELPFPFFFSIFHFQTFPAWGPSGSTSYRGNLLYSPLRLFHRCAPLGIAHVVISICLRYGVKSYKVLKEWVIRKSARLGDGEGKFTLSQHIIRGIEEDRSNRKACRDVFPKDDHQLLNQFY